MVHTISKGGKILIVCICIFIIFLIADSRLNAIYSKQYSFQIAAASKNYEVDPCLVASIIKNTSNFDEKYEGNLGYGLMGLVEIDGIIFGEVLDKDYISKEQLFDPTYNIALGVFKMSIIKKEEKDELSQIIRFFYGKSTLEKWKVEGLGFLDSNIDKKEKEFIKKVYKRYLGYKKYRGAYYNKLLEAVS